MTRRRDIALADELHARMWTVEDFARRVHCSEWRMRRLIEGKAPLTPRLAQAIGAAFGTQAAVWENLERAYRQRVPFTGRWNTP